jgi:hypothetical protein
MGNESLQNLMRLSVSLGEEAVQAVVTGGEDCLRLEWKQDVGGI